MLIGPGISEQEQAYQFSARRREAAAGLVLASAGEVICRHTIAVRQSINQ